MLRRDRILKAISALRGDAAPSSETDARDQSSSEPLPDLREALVKILQGEWSDTQQGPVFLKDIRYPLNHRHGKLPLEAPLGAEAKKLATIFPTPSSRRSPCKGDSEDLRQKNLPELKKLGFFDIETTGLSGGTGTYAFLICLGSFETDAFRIRQYFLAKLEHERAMLTQLAQDLSELDGIVSYNGKAFDLPLVQTRWTLSRVLDPCKNIPHLDLLHTVRRLYRHRLESCRLAEAETRLIEFERQGDVPSSMVPSLYFDYIRAGRISPLRGVLRHNEWDVLSMVGILASLLDLFSQNRPGPGDAASLGRWWELEDRPDLAEGFYKMALEGSSGDSSEPASEDDSWRFAAKRFALIRKRAGARREVVDLWNRLWVRGDHGSAVEIAKYLEHEARDLQAAAKITRDLLRVATAAERPAVEHRLARLERKLQARG